MDCDGHPPDSNRHHYGTSRLSKCSDKRTTRATTHTHCLAAPNVNATEVHKFLSKLAERASKDFMQFLNTIRTDHFCKEPQENRINNTHLPSAHQQVREDQQPEILPPYNLTEQTDDVRLHQLISLRFEKSKRTQPVCPFRN